MQGDWALVGSAALLGLAALPHCAAMCSVPCGGLGVAPGGPGGRSFLLGRLLGYAALGAAVSMSVSHAAQWADASAALRPLWHVAQAAGLLLGLFLLVTGRQPGWMSAWNPVAGLGLGRRPRTVTNTSTALPQLAWPAVSAGSVQVPVAVVRPGASSATARALGIGMAWSLWSCGLLQSGLVLAGLTSTPVGGAAAMAAFAITSAPGLWLGARLLQSVASGRRAAEPWALRLAGLLMAGASLWALAHPWLPAAAAWCRSAW